MAELSRRQWIAMSGSAALAALLSGRASSATRLSLNENAFGASPSVSAAVNAEVSHVHRYVDQDGVDALVRQIADLERLRTDQVVLGEVLEPLGLYLGAQARGGEVLFSEPGYTALTDSGAILGLKARAIPLNSDLANDLPALRAALTSKTTAVSLVNPHNPSGTVNAIGSLDAFIAEASARALVVVDEAYLEYDPDFAGRTATRHVREGRNVLVFRTLAKIYGLAGLSIGYALAPAPLVQSLKGAGIGSAHSLNRLSLAAASAALSDQAHVAYVRDAAAAQRSRLNAAIDALGWQRTDSHADFVFFRPTSAAQLRQRFEGADIAIGKPFPPLSDWIRITVGTEPETNKVLEILNG